MLAALDITKLLWSFRAFILKYKIPNYNKKILRKYRIISTYTGYWIIYQVNIVLVEIMTDNSILPTELFYKL